MAHMTAALFDTRADAERAVMALRDHGIDQDNISVVARAGDGSGKTSDLDASDRATPPGKGEGISTTTTGDMERGAEEGAAIGAGLGILAGLASIFIPGFGLVTAGGALATAIGGMVGTAVGGAVVGGVTGYLVDLGVPQQAARGYSEGIERGGVLVSITDTQGLSTMEVQEIFSKYNGHSTGYYDNLRNLPPAGRPSNPDTLDATNHLSPNSPIARPRDSATPTTSPRYTSTVTDREADRVPAAGPRTVVVDEDDDTIV